METGQFKKWLALLVDQRRSKRHSDPGLVAYYWNGSVPMRRTVKDISHTGAYIETDERWYLGTLLMVTLQRAEETAETAAYVTVPCQVVRHGSDGAGVNFMLTTKEERQTVRQALRAVGRRGKDRQSGEAIVEFALMVPLVFLVIVNVLNFGGFIFCWLTVADAARAAADYACTDNTTATSPAVANLAGIQTLVQNATQTLPNASASNPAVTVCLNSNGNTTSFLSTAACTSAAPPADPETAITGGAVYSTVAVDVTYTFTPFLAGSSFLRFGLPTLPSTIHRRMVVRWP